MLNKSKLNVYFSLALIIGGFLVWKNVLNNQFLYDDDTFVVLNENIRTLTPLTKFFTPAASSNNPQMNRDVWRPLTTFSYALNYKLSGLNPKSFHLVNLLIHIINGLVIFWLVFLLTKKEIPAFFTAMVFLIHPVQTETVAWVSQRSNILFLFFYLLSLIFYIKRQKSSILFNLFSILCFILSLLSKEMAISLPLIILAYEYILNRQKFFSAFYRSLPYFIILFFFVMIRSTVIGQTAQTTYWAGGFVPQMLTMVKGFAYYVKLMFVPCPLSAEYLFPVKYAVDVEVALYGIILAGIIYLGLRLRTTRPIISFGIFLFLLSLVPVSNIIPIRTIINERFLYPAVIGFGLILGSGLIEVFKSEFNRKYLRCIPVLALFIAYSFISINRNNDWKDHWSFVTANLKTCPQSATLHYGMGRAYASKGMYEEASKEFELCLKIDPQYDDATSDLGRLSAKTGNIDEAIEKYRQTVHKRVDFFDGLNNLGLAYFNKGNYEEAVKTLEKACKIKPADLEAKTNLATAYAYYGDFDKAIELCKEILKENPKMEKTSRNLKLFMEARSKIIEPNIKENQNKVTKFIQKKFHDPVVRESIMHSAGVEFENTKGGITLKKGYLGSSQSKDELNPAEIQALESMKKRETASASNENQPKFVFSENMKNGYTVKYNGEAISVKHLNSDSNVETETGVLVYKNAYQSTDVLYVFGNNQCQEMILLRNEKSPAKFEYEYSKKININSKGEIEVSGLSLSKPVIFDSDGKKINGTYQKTSDNRVLLSFNKENLKYPLLIDPTWRTTNSMTTVRAWHTATLLPNGKVLITGGWNGSYLSTAELYDPSAGTFSNTGSMSTARQHHAATLLPSGKVLITGGFNGSSGVISTVELYDPSAGTFSTTGSMTDTRYSHTATLLPNGKVLIAGGTFDGSAVLSTAELYDPSAGTFSTTGSMSTARYGHTATLLPNGKVLITGGNDDGTFTPLSTAELYDPTAGTFSTTGSMATARWVHTATLLPNGKVLITGGTPNSGTAALSTAELYDPSAGTFSTTGSMSTARESYTATLLPNGKVLIAGGTSDGSVTLSTAELYDPSAGTFSNTGSMTDTRYSHTATLLPSGKVLIAGGRITGGSFLSTAELYDPSAGTFSATGSMSTTRYSHTTTLLPNGKVLIAGGTSDGSVTLSTAELYDPSNGTFSTTGSMSSARYAHTTTLLPNGKVLITGGRITGGSFLSTAELYDPSTGTFSTTGSMTIARSYHTATLLPNGKVLITGGSFSGALSTAELYDPLAGTFSTTGSMSTARKYHTAVLLPNGKVLITGGYNYDEIALSTAELYDPSAGTFSTTGSMSTARVYHIATLLPNGKVLITGGTAGAGAVLSTAELYDPSAGTFSTTGSMSAARYYYTATLLPNGKVLIIGGWDNSGTCVSTVELYDPSAGTFSTTGSMLTVRYYHTATLLPSGKVLITGGGDFWVGFATAELVSYTEYDYSVVASTMQPSIALVAGSGSFPVNISKDTVYTIIGQRFKGYSEGSGGNSGQMNSPTNYPRVYLQKMDTGNSDSIDVTTSVYPMTSAQWQNADTSISFKTPNNLSSGFWLLYVMSNAIPSNGVEVNCVWPSAETTTPSVPSAFSGVAQSTTAINWSWTDNSSSELGYRVKTSTGGTIKTLSADTTCWTEISLTPNTQYSRYVVSYNLSGESAASSSEAKYTLANPPAGVTVTGVTNTTIDLSWNANGGSLFKIERSLSGSGLWTAATDYYALTTFSDTSLIQGTTYLYRLWGYNVDNAISVEPLGVVSTTTSTSLVETPDAIDIPDAEIAVSSISCSIKVPQEGKRISGNRVTVMAEITNGELSGIKSITFKYRPTNSATWLDITAANINHPNPDIDSPYFIHWDVTILTEGAYNIRAVLKDKDNNYSTGEAITVYVDKAKPDVEENVIGEISQKKEKITSAQESIITVGNTKNNAYIEVKIPTGAVTTETIIKVENDVSDPPEIKNFEKIQLFDITLESGQTELQNGATAQITISYPDINNDGIIDETSIKENDLSIFSYNENQSVWERNNTTKTDKTKKTCTAYIKHFSIYGLFRAVSNNLGDILLYPNPYIPFDGKSDNGKPYSASDSYSGIIFENITQNIKLEIYTVSGECVLDKYIDETAGRYQWDAKNGDGKDVASGIYVAVIKSPLTGQKKIKKIAIVR